ncbi:MAG: SusC/RagA family TonB-linked outer membrane protein [Flavobacteriaceae bacterium]|nr:SusC/RagA family TonB-linked outer membrane protein [Flavobacteriaceae bacterium]
MNKYIILIQNLSMDNNNKYIARHVFALALIAMLFLVQTETFAQTNNIDVTGNITSSEDGMSLPGVSILEKGTSNGVSSDFDGNYNISVAGNATLVFSFIGFETQEIAVSAQTSMHIVLLPSAEALDEIVVTALGIKREEKSLGYSVGKVKAEEFTRVVNENVLKSMSGKVAGVTINSTGGTGSSVSMVIRGATSLSTDNQPLFVVDGVPIESTDRNNGGIGSRNLVDYGNAISDLDPESIESVSILKGPSAAALYGSRAGNGVVLITTKKAKEGEAMSVTISSNTVFDVPFKFFDRSNRFTIGFFSYRPEDVGSNILPDIAYGDGPATGPENDKGYYAVQFDAPLDANGQRIPTELKSYPNNIKNFLNDYAITTINSVSISSAAQAVNYRLGVSNMTHEGLIPNSDLNRNSFSLAASSKLWNKLTVSTNINFNHSFADNRPAGDRGTNPLEAAYLIPSSVDIRSLRDYGTGNNVKRVIAGTENPYFLANEVNNSFSRYRVYGNIVANWEISDSFSIMGRYLLNKSDEVRETKIAPGYSRENNNGTYGISNSTFLETNMEIMGTYKKDWENFSLSSSVGGNILYQAGNSISNSAIRGAGLIVPNLFTVENISSGALQYRNSRSEKAINSIYGLVNLSYKNMLYLDITARNDWSSTLPAENRLFLPFSFFKFLSKRSV